MGFNYGKDGSLIAIVAQIILCMVIGAILSFLFFKTNTLWVPILAHASINAIDKFTPKTLFMSIDQSVNMFIGPNLIGLIGGVGLIVFSLYVYKKLYTDKLNIKN